jgi:hypothetical protein
MVSVKGSTHYCVRHAGCRNRRRFERSHRPGLRKPVHARTARIFFSCERTQQVKRSLAANWLAGVAMLFAAASWGVLGALLGG